MAGLTEETPSSPPSPTDAALLQEEPVDPSFMIIPPAQDPLLHYLTSKITHSGKRTKAAGRVSRILMHIHGYTRAEPLQILREAVFAASPAVRVAMHKKGAKNIASPMPLSEKQRTRFGVEWILQASEKKAGKSLEIRLAKEMVAVVQGTSEALKKKEEVHRFAMLNRCVFVCDTLESPLTTVRSGTGVMLRAIEVHFH
jgi:small subunit ribosomal protein S7